MAVGLPPPPWQFAAMPNRLPDHLSLGADFPAARRQQWLQLVEKVLKGASFEERLVHRTYDGLRIEPLSPRRSHAIPVSGREPGAPWAVMQRVDHPQPEAANVEALHDVANGATGLMLEFAGAVGAHGYGLAPVQEAIARALQGIDLDRIALDLDPGPAGGDAAATIAQLIARGGLRPDACNICFGLDPIGACAAAGGSALPWSALVSGLKRTVSTLAGQGFHGPFAAADARVVHNAGGSEAQELAYALAVGVQYLRALEAEGIALDRARGMLHFRLGADADQFLTLAKFRALRKLWACVERACGLAPARIFLSAETAWRMMTRRDPSTNMLRTTIAAVSAGLGGADAVTVLPFTMALGLPDRFARRLARNTQLVLIEESNLARVADPAAGAGSVEDLTDLLCEAAWKQFQAIEKAGGAWAALEAGEMQQAIAAVRAQRQAALERRTDALVGTSEFVEAAELPVTVADVPPVQPSLRPGKSQFEPLPSFRLAQPFEDLDEPRSPSQLPEPAGLVCG
jgi:methylmalonyl-CoA mutase